METALADVGITPTVISSVDQVAGSLPLIHTQCCVFKVHGDYLDTRIRNTTQELEEYPNEFRSLLDRIFDEFGLVVCGWSADWDIALRASLTRAPSRRFSTYWAVRGTPSDSAQQLITQRAANVIPISDADSFFKSLQEKIQSLQEFSRPHPVSVDVAVATTKRFLSEPKYRIQLADFIDEEVTRLIQRVSGEQFATQGVPEPNTASLNGRFIAYETASETLVRMAAVGGYWSEEVHMGAWQTAVRALSIANRTAGFTDLIELQRLPATLLLYAFGLSAIEANRLYNFGLLLKTIVRRDNNHDIQAVQRLPPFRLFQQPTRVGNILTHPREQYAPVNERILALLKKMTSPIHTTADQFELCFDKLEILIALGYGHAENRDGQNFWAPPGLYGYHPHNRLAILDEIAASITAQGNSSPYVTSKIFGDDVERCNLILGQFRQWSEQLAAHWF